MPMRSAATSARLRSRGSWETTRDSESCRMPSPQCSVWRARPDQVLERSREETEHGAVLIQVLFMAVLGLLVSSMLLSGLVLQVDSVRRARQAPQTFLAAESGVNHSIQHIVNTVSREEGAIEQFRVLAALWNRPEPFTGVVGSVEYEARVVDVSPNLAFRAFVQKYADVTIEAEARPTGMRAQERAYQAQGARREELQGLESAAQELQRDFQLAGANLPSGTIPALNPGPGKGGPVITIRYLAEAPYV